MSNRFFIPDGFTLDGKVDAVPGLHCEVKFKYRPAGYRSRAKLNSAAGDEHRLQVVADILADHIGEVFALTGESPEKITLSKELIKDKVPTDIVETMLGYVMGALAPSLEEQVGKSPAASGSS